MDLYGYYPRQKMLHWIMGLCIKSCGRLQISPGIYDPEETFVDFLAPPRLPALFDFH